MGAKAFDDIMAGLQDALSYAQGDRTRGPETVVEVSTVDMRADALGELRPQPSGDAA